jgi:uncharacterized protein (DUF1330 family)
MANGSSGSESSGVRPTSIDPGRVALIDLVASPSHEARIAFPSLMKNVLAPVGGRVAWAGSIDGQLVGKDLERFHDVIISEYPTREACLRAVAERSAWQPESFVDELRSYIVKPTGAFASAIQKLAFGGMRLLGKGPPAADTSDPDRIATLRPAGPRPELDPTPDQLRWLASESSQDRVVMLNFLDFRKHAEYAQSDAEHDADTRRSGAAAYLHYGRVTTALIGRLGGRIRWRGSLCRALGADTDERWSSVVFVEYPSRAAFLGMLLAPAYAAVTHHRDAALSRTRLLVCTSHAEHY